MTLPRIGWRGAAYLASLGAGAVLIVRYWDELASTWSGHSVTFAAVTGLMIVATVVQAANFTSFLAPARGPKVWAMAQFWALGVLANYLGPFQPGVAVRVALLARSGVPVIESSLATARQTFASLWLALPVLAVSLAAFDPVAMAIPAIVLFASFAALSPALPLLRRLAVRMLRGTRADGVVPHIEKAIALPSLRSAAGVLSQYALSALVFYLGYREFGVEVTVGAALGLSCVVFASSLVALLPGNVGVLEALLALFGQIHELPVDQAVALALLFRGAHIAGALLLAATSIGRGRRPASDAAA